MEQKVQRSHLPSPLTSLLPISTPYGGAMPLLRLRTGIGTLLTNGRRSYQDSLCFGKCTMSCIHRYIVIENIFTAVKSPLSHRIFQPFSNQSFPVASADVFTVSIALSFLECHTVGIVQYIVFSDWFHLLFNMNLSFPLSTMIPNFISLNSILLSRCSPVCLLIHLPKDFLVASKRR